MYSLDDYGEMIADRTRMGAYTEAIARTVKRGDAVVDIGSGTGIFALLACQAGARRVYAIESDPVVQLIRQLAAANGFADRIEVLQASSTQVILPERAQVVLSDLRGALPLFGTALGSLEDARVRFLAEGGTFIPRRDTLFAALLSVAEFYQEIRRPWDGAVDGLDMTSSLPLVLNSIHKRQFKPGEVLSRAKPWCVLDYKNGADPRASAVLTLEAARPGTAHGIGIWFDAELVDGVGYSCGPDGPETVYGHILLPWLKPLELEAGEAVRVELHADPVGEDYVWRWNTRSAREEFQQSTFFGASFSAAALRRRSAEYVPVLSEVGQAERWLLQAMDGQTEIQKIAEAAAQRFPHVFPRWELALRRASELSDKYSR